MLKNGSFEEGWTDLPPGPGYLINQNPNGWTLNIVDVDQPLYDSGDLAKGIPECVHKLSRQLPANEQLGAENALILDGDVTYKIFSANAPFGAELVQTVTGLKPGTQAKLTAPILAVIYDEPDPYGAESGAWVDTVGSDDSDDWHGRWVNGHEMGNRNWHYHEVDFTVPDSGTVTVHMRVKSKWPRPKDFFIDDVRLEAVAAGETPGAPGPGGTAATVVVKAPAGMNVVAETGDDPHTIVVRVPPGVRLDVQ